MITTRFNRFVMVATLVLGVALVPLLGASCAGATVSTSAVSELGTFQVPNINLDAYLYFHQDNPTLIPRSLVNSPADISLDSLSLWGIVDPSNPAVGSALAFINAADASYIYALVPHQTNIWTKLSDRTIYVVYGSGGPSQSLISAISNNDFKQFADRQALGEISLMPSGVASRRSGTAVLKPTPAAIDLVKPYLDASTLSTINSIYTWAKPQLITVGLYTSQPLNLTDIFQVTNPTSLWDLDLGAVVSVDSSIPGLVFSPLAGQYLNNNWYAKTNLGNLTLYKISLDAGNGKTIPLLVNVSGNHVFITVSGKESYAQTLMAEITR